MSRGPKGARIPTSVQNHLGDAKLEKGNWNGLYLIAWDVAEICTQEDCPMYDRCVYKDQRHMRKKEQGKPGYTNKCLLQQRYLKNVLHAVVETMMFKNDSSKEQVVRMGLHIIPLYAQLFKFKMWEYGHEELVYTSEKGTPKVHPVYKEIREIIKTIEGVWVKIGGNRKNAKRAGEIGDTEFVDAMYEEIDENEAPKQITSEGLGLDFDEGYEETKQSRKKKRRKK